MPTGTKAEKASKRRVVAKGVVAGQSTKRIAAAAKCSERHVQRLAAEEDTQFLIAELMRPHRKELARLATKAIAAINGALSANQKDKADHKSRLWGVDRFKDMVELAQGGKPQEKPREDDKLWTWEEFVMIYRRRRDGNADDQRATPEAL